MSRHVVVLGGGFAGLRAAVSLADAGARVTVLESRNSLGGRARSFVDPATAEVVDNGQHLFLAGYHRTLAFLDRLGTRGKIVFQDRLRVRFAEPGGKLCVLDCPPLPAPLHLIGGLLGLRGMPLQDKLRLVRVWSGLREKNSSGETVDQWLARAGQGEKSRRLFWDPLTIAALNEDPKKASAAGLKQVLRTMMGEPWPNARLGMSAVGLSDLYGEQSRRIIEGRQGQVRLNCLAAGLDLDGNRVRAVRLADGSRIEADAVISSVPPAALLKLLSPEAPGCAALSESLRRFGSSPILSVNLWLARPVTEELFVALIGCRFQWLFNKQAILKLAGGSAGYVSLIISAAAGFLDRPNEELVRMAV
ncbi:MAG: hydroxysqualene dehydroxylase HpnE, partial [Candidatus Omnitrophota bacterium]|nr:hydroxysqualene dehydroxylase HpnE [Candidatus Omnitrophota bacterium]